MWTINFCLCNASYGVIVWKARILTNSDYTAVSDNFHVFALGEVDVLVGLMFSDTEQACEFHTTYTMWNQERIKDDGKKGYISKLAGQSASGYKEPAKFEKKMISKPCNFQHIQGTQAIDECVDIEKIKVDIVAFLFGLGTKAGRSETDAVARKAGKTRSKKKREPVKAKLEFREIGLPLSQSSTPTQLSPTDISPTQNFVPLNMDQMELVISTNSGADGASVEVNPTTQRLNSPVQSFATDSNGYAVGVAAASGCYAVNPGQGNVAELVQSSSSQGSNLRVTQAPSSYQNPTTSTFQEFNSNQESYTYDVPSSKMDINLEKEFSESLYKPLPMAAN